MFPRDTAKTTITIYSYYYPEPEFLAYSRRVVHDCIWQQDSQEHYKKTGVLNKDAVRLLIPFDSEYFSTQNGEVFGGNGWTVQLGPEKETSYIVKGEVDFEFPNAPGAFDFFKDYIQPFEKQVKYKRPKEIIEHFTGSRSLWMIEVRL